MADASITLPGTGTPVDTRTIGTDHRQVLVIGDPAVVGGVAPVDAILGLTVNMAASSPGIIPTGTVGPGTAPATGIATLGQYNSANPTPTSGQSVALQLGPNGNLLTMPYGNPANYVSGATASITTTTQTALLPAPCGGPAQLHHADHCQQQARHCRHRRGDPRRQHADVHDPGGGGVRRRGADVPDAAAPAHDSDGGQLRSACRRRHQGLGKRLQGCVM